MSSKGTTVRTVRICEEMVAEMRETIDRRNQNSRETPWTLSDFIGIAIREKLEKMSRGRRNKTKYEERLADPFIGK